MIFILFLGLCVFTYFAPSLFWGITMPELIQMITETDTLGQKWSEIKQTLGLSEQTLSQWATTKLAICAGILIVGTIILIILKKAIKK